MKMLITGAAMLAFLSFATVANAQKIKLVDGDPSPLKNESSVAFKFTYDNMAIGKFENGQDYIDKKKAEYNAKQDGKGDRWAEAWVNDRSARYEPKFIDLFLKYSLMSEKKDAKYTIIFHTSFTEAGYNVYISRHNAEINGEATIVETADPSKVIATISIEKAPGRTFGGDDYDAGTRITESYADAGKYLAKFIKKN
ncbi:hypothetical protein [Mucilaginibacter sp. dw_454]|uniref:hypothetical protein n=1 Tax=Mucilaginibacter sp. dw_454 TaxID=2720079 RepID=UPI001BD2DDDD|nr:hypothetical protein [Mucilaginibacter sp. dw_454]